MTDTLRNIAVALILLLVCAPAPLAAQSASDLMRAQQRGDRVDGLSNSNPFESDEEEADQPADTTSKERKLRKPLESYFFNDSIRSLNNFEWNIDREYNKVTVMPIDTTLNVWRLDYPIYHEGVGDAGLGALGQASVPLNYFKRPNSFDFQFSDPYHAYIYTMENVPFYNLKKPFILFTYIESGQKRYREEHFELTVGHNISPSTGFNLNYKSRGTRGLYAWSRTKNHNLSLAFNHTGKRYSVHAGYVNNHIEARENGGVVGEWAIRDTVFEMPSGVPMRLADAQAENMYRNNAFFVEQSYGIALAPMTDEDFSMAGLPAVYLGHSFEYNSWSKIYSDLRATYVDERASQDENGGFVPETLEYYQNWYIDPTQTRDSIYERVISNRLFIQAQPWNRDGVIGTINGGVGLDLHTYSQFGMEDYASGKMKKVDKSSYFAYGSIEGKIRRFVDWGADFKFYPSGYRGGDLNVGANLTLTGYLRGHPLILEGRFVTRRRTPSYFQQNLFSNHYVWANELDKEEETRFDVSFRVPDYALELAGWQSVVSNKVYYGQQSLITQHDGTVSLTGLYARKDFRIGGFHLDNKLLVQWSSEQSVVPVPLLSAFLSYYYEFWVVRDVLRMQFGIDGRYTSSYYAQGWNPALGEFFNQRDVKVGNYPYLDLFLTAKWKRMRIFLKYQHINRGLFGNGEYFAIAKYPLNPGMFKMGISWGFYD